MSEYEAVYERRDWVGWKATVFSPPKSKSNWSMEVGTREAWTLKRCRRKVERFARRRERKKVREALVEPVEL